MRYSSFLEVNLSHLEHNYNLVLQKAKGCEVLFMVKANAYGHGLEEIVRFSTQELKIKQFGMASLGEAEFIHRLFPEVTCYVFSDHQIKTKDYTIYKNKIIPVISNWTDLKFYKENELCVPLALKMNTGMNRLGINSDDTEVLADYLKKSNLQIEHFMTHFSDSYLPHKKKNKSQHDQFLHTKKHLKDSGVTIRHTSIANSGAIENGVGLDESVVRPGLMMYGPQSTMGDKVWDGKILSSLKTEIIDVRELKKGQPVGYGSHVLANDGIVAICSIGYGDGIFNHYQKLPVTHNGVEGKIIGRINMDMIQVWFPADALDKLQSGEQLSLWGNEQKRIQEISHHTNYNAYEIFCAISFRVPRRYI